MPVREFNVGSTAHAVFAALLSNSASGVSHTNGLCSHAELYCFAMQHLIDTLQDACLHMRYRDTVDFKVNPRTIANAVELIQYIYDKTSAAADLNESHEDHEDLTGVKLRELVLQVALAQKNQLNGFAEYKSFLFSGGDFVVDIVEGGTKNAT